MSAETYWDLVAGYGAFWMIIALALLRLQHGQRRIRRELDVLWESVKEAREDVRAPEERRSAVG